MQNQPVIPTDNRPPWQRLLLRWLISSLAIFAATWLVPGIEFSGPGWQIGVVALVFGLLNALLRPLIYLLTCPLVLLTLGLFGLVINAVMLGITSALADQLGIQFHVYGFWPAFFGGLVISLVATALSFLAGDTNVQVVRVK
ncbi:phage holin family protein [Oscillochloris sp. ZM17-4]|uniref:phage holin family protein n=1 Tax=Oscillochloris sp. ZM17-4 TaxID=2866714 RepID=UPI001C7302C0|nr:phage holin family protein [Oscillochloris sp. ZM17-4]MBX0330304.1 phage holin family protein [Oscillochloris sp. ZM17-4]